MTTRKIVSLIAGLCLITTAGFARADSWDTAQSLGIVLGSESACGVTLDAASIKQWIDTNVSAKDLKFTALLGMQSGVTQRSFKDMSPMFKEAHCAQIKRIVETLKLGH
jgi:hypothetical protein